MMDDTNTPISRRRNETRRIIAMSQSNKIPKKDETPLPHLMANYPGFPVINMPFQYNHSNISGQQFYRPTIYPNMGPFSLANAPRPPGFGLGFGAYGPFYPTPNGMIPSMPYPPGMQPVVPMHPLMAPPMQPSSTTGSPTPAKDIERNQQLNIRECQSPFIAINKENSKGPRVSLPEIDHPGAKTNGNGSAASPLVLNSESDRISSSSSATKEIDSDHVAEDFLIFLEEKNKPSTPRLPELNPFANEFLLSKSESKTSALTESVDSKGSSEMNSSYRLLFDNLIEKSLESIEAIKKSNKKTSVNEISVQCNLPTNNCVHRSTQTSSQPNDLDLIDEYSVRTLKLMERLKDDFRDVYQNNFHQQFETMGKTCDELRQLLVFIRHLAVSSDRKRKENVPIDCETPFQNLLEDLNQSGTTTQSEISWSAGRGARPLASSNRSSFSCRSLMPQGQ